MQLFLVRFSEAKDLPSFISFLKLLRSFRSPRWRGKGHTPAHHADSTPRGSLKPMEFHWFIKHFAGIPASHPKNHGRSSLPPQKHKELQRFWRVRDLEEVL